MSHRARVVMATALLGVCGCTHKTEPHETYAQRDAGTAFALRDATSPDAASGPRAASRPAPTTREVICRDGWGARPSGPGLVPHIVRRLTVHHSGAEFADNRRAVARIRGAQRYHQGAKGFPDIAYHFVIDRAGNVFEGRPPNVKGDTPTDYDPTGHLLVCLLGNFEVHDAPPAQRDALVDVLAWGAVEFRVPPGSIAGHRDHAHTLCPGRNLYALVRDGTIRRLVENKLAAGGVRLTRICGAAATGRVRLIEQGTEAQRR